MYAHIYHSHFPKIVSLGEEAHLNTCFKVTSLSFPFFLSFSSLRGSFFFTNLTCFLKHFIFFVQEFSLIKKQELQPLAELITSLTKRDKKAREKESKEEQEEENKED